MSLGEAAQAEKMCGELFLGDPEIGVLGDKDDGVLCDTANNDCAGVPGCDNLGDGNNTLDVGVTACDIFPNFSILGVTGVDSIKGLVNASGMFDSCSGHICNCGRFRTDGNVSTPCDEDPSGLFITIFKIKF